MNQLKSFVTKEFRHIFRDVRTMMILLVLPVVMVLLFGYVITTEVKDIRLAVVDLSHDELTQQVIDRFSQNHYFILTGSAASAAAGRAMLEHDQADMVVVFGENFAQEIVHSRQASVQLLVDGSEPNQAAARAAYAQQLLLSVAQELSATMGIEQQFQIAPVTHALFNPNLRSEFNFVPGNMGMILMLICAMMTSVSIVREKETGTMEVLLASPLPPLVIIIAKLVPYFVISFINLVTILVLCKYLLGLPFAGSLPAFMGISIIYLIVSLSLGLLISTLVRTQLAAMILSLLLIIPTIYFSGMTFPIESMPVMYQHVSACIPARWYVAAVRKLMIQGVEVRHVMRETAILATMAVVLVSVSLATFRKRL
ncbi:MAG: ABC transporter permease [Muribaculaceae bacterium]|nr:ABC transporter permease [Muribaculaceae bacterium]